MVAAGAVLVDDAVTAALVVDGGATVVGGGSVADKLVVTGAEDEAVGGKVVGGRVVGGKVVAEDGPSGSGKESTSMRDPPGNT